MGEFEQTLRNLLLATAQMTKKILLLEIEGDQAHARQLVEPGIAMKGVRLWFLLASCLIASIGLNTNSNAVIIGAMLISPLMGPILGLGFGMATASRRIIRNSVKNIVFAVVISLLVSSLYFLVSPFQDPTVEILARTAPNLLDLLVAIAAAFAGVVAMNSKSLAGAVPGVAIATAIMPPLCSSAFGIAQGNWKIALGSFYLFFVNAVAIAVVAFLLFKRMHFSVETEETTEYRKLRPAVVSAAVLLIVLPLAWSLWDAWRDNYIQRSVAKLVQSYKPKLEIVSWQWDGGSTKQLVLYNFRKANQSERLELESALQEISPNATLELHESSVSPDMESLANQIRSSQITDLVNNPKIMEGLVRLATTDGKSLDMMKMAIDIETEFASLLGPMYTVRAFVRSEPEINDVLFLIKSKSPRDRRKLKQNAPQYQNWLTSRFGTLGRVQLETM